MLSLPSCRPKERFQLTLNFLWIKISIYQCIYMYMYLWYCTWSLHLVPLSGCQFYRWRSRVCCSKKDKVTCGCIFSSFRSLSPWSKNSVITRSATWAQYKTGYYYIKVFFHHIFQETRHLKPIIFYVPNHIYVYNSISKPLKLYINVNMRHTNWT